MYNKFIISKVKYQYITDKKYIVKSQRALKNRC